LIRNLFSHILLQCTSVNPYSFRQGVESEPEVINARFNQMLSHMKIPGSRIVPRLGVDVYGSCGMFVNQTL
jgi:hypothetical protein